MAYKYRPRSAEQWDRRANQSGGDFEGFVKDEFKMWTPKKGASAVRLLPPTFDNAAHCGIDVWVHYSVGPNNASLLCLAHMKDGRCPLCEARTQALKVGDEEQARELKAAKRVLLWMLDRNDEDRGPMLWAAPFTLDRTISALAKDRSTGEVYQLDDPDQGYDIYFDKQGEKMRVEYTGVQIARKSSSVSDAALNYIEEHPLPDVLIWRDYNEVMKLFTGGSSEEPSKVEAPTVRRRLNGNGEAPTRRAQPAEDAEAPAPRETPRRSVEASEQPTRGRREDINEEVPWNDETPAKSAADRLREKFRG